MANGPATEPGVQTVQLTVNMSGTGAGTISSKPGGINCGKTCSASFNTGTQVTLMATPGADSTFAGWQGACRGTGTCKVTLKKNTSVSATFVADLTLSVALAGTGSGMVTSNPSGIDCPLSCSSSFDAGTQVILTATPEAGSTFAGWQGACGGTGGCKVTLNKNTSVSAMFVADVSLSVTLAGTGSGTVTSKPSGIDCPHSCGAEFVQETSVTLTATAATGSTFAGWSGACTGTSSTCGLTLSANTQVTATFNAATVNVLNHIIFMSQENRSFDSYFGALREYWVENGYADESFDGLPQFNTVSGPPPLNGPPPSIPGCNPNDPYSPPPAPFQDCVYDPSNPVTSYHLITQCIENPSPFWNESHVDWDYQDQTDINPYKGNGFVWTAGHDARDNGYYDNNPYHDTDGVRAMGYYDGTDLNYYYFIASNFATSDRWFDPIMTRTEPNRDYLMAATSQGYVYPIGSNQHDKKSLTATTIFQELISAGITWKIYVNPTNVCSGPPYQPSCLVKLSAIDGFDWATTLVNDYPNDLGTIGISNSDWDNDLANGTLPQVVFIEREGGLDEHPSDYDSSPINIQQGALYVSGIINQLMSSQYWKDSAFILTWDEFGGIYDHVSPQPTVNPDGIAPVDLESTDICYGTPNIGTCNFTYTGNRIPLIVISPYAKQHYVDHTVSDSTAWLKLVETRFKLPPLTQRDAAQPDMTQFFDFANPPWMTPPTPPTQNTSGPCYLDKLP